MTGPVACQTGQENVAYYTESRADLGDGDAKNWWMLENDITYGVVTRIHGNATTKFNWTCRGNDQPVAGNGSALPCTSQVMDIGNMTKLPGFIDQWPTGSTADDGACHAIRFKLEKFNLGSGSNRVCWSAQGYTYTGLPYDATTKFGYKTQLGLKWDGTGAVNLTDRSTNICKVATQTTQGGTLSENGWVDVWCNVVRCPGTLNNAHYVYYSKDGGATWTESSPSPIVACRNDVPNSRIDIYAGNGATKLIEYLLDYNCVGNKATPPGTIAIPAKPAAVVDTSIGVVKSSPLGTPATFNGVITNVFSGKVPWDLTGTGVTIYYLEQPDGVANPLGRENGVKVWISNGQSPTDIDGNPYPPAIGDYVRVVGTLGKWNCEKMILACSMTQQTGTIAKPGALGMNNKAVGASYKSTMSTFIPEQLPAGGAPGTNSHGLYARVWGKVTYVGATFFYVDDGSGLVDGVGDETTAVSTVKGIRVVDVLGFGLPALNATVSVTGSLGNTRVQFIDPTPPAVIDRVIPVVWMTDWQLELAAP